MRAVCLVDTSVFCELLAVPGKSQRVTAMATQAEFKEKLGADEVLLLPMTTILETGNHIGQNGNGGERRAAAQRFTAQVRLALKGESPFNPTPLFQPQEMLSWLDAFPDWAMGRNPQGRGSGLGDLTIVKLFEQQCRLNQGRRVYIWSLDVDLQGYEQEPQL